MKEVENVNIPESYKAGGDPRLFRMPFKRWMLFALVLTIFILLYSSIHYYIYRRLVWAFAVESSGSLWAFRALVIMLAISFPTAHFLIRAGIGPFTIVADWFGSLWLGLGFYMLLTSALGHLIWIIFRINSFDHYLIAYGANPRLTIFFPLLLLALLLSGIAFYNAERKAPVTQFTARMKNLPKELDGFSIVQISDLHLGVVVDKSRAEKIVDQINLLDPDLVVITGDLVDEEPGRLDAIFPEFARLKTKYGVLASTGNHEFYAGVKEVVRRAAQVNIKFLRNEKTTVAGSLLVYGIDDPARAELGGVAVPFETVIGPEARKSPSILLYHRPSKLEKAASLGIDLMLSGHTHNGQLWPFRHIVRIFFPRITGHFTEGGCHLYVSRGIGTWGPPMRLGSKPEIVKIILRPANTLDNPK